MRTRAQRNILKLAAGVAPISALWKLIEPTDSVLEVILTCTGILSMSALQVVMMDLIITIYTIGFRISDVNKQILDSTRSDQQSQK